MEVESRSGARPRQFPPQRGGESPLRNRTSSARGLTPDAARRGGRGRRRRRRRRGWRRRRGRRPRGGRPGEGRPGGRWSRRGPRESAEFFFVCLAIEKKGSAIFLFSAAFFSPEESNSLNSDWACDWACVAHDFLDDLDDLVATSLATEHPSPSEGSWGTTGRPKPFDVAPGSPERPPRPPSPGRPPPAAKSEQRAPPSTPVVERVPDDSMQPVRVLLQLPAALPTRPPLRPRRHTAE